jgi:hypothetical protein
MRKIRIFWLALVAVFAFTAILATTASAETTLLAEWLASGAEFTGALTIEAKGSVLLEDSAFKFSVECKGTIIGAIGGSDSGLTEASEVLTTSGVKTGVALSGTSLECEKKSGCENTAKVWPLGLPWHSIAYLLENGTFNNSGLGEGGGFEVECTVLLTKTSEECKSSASGSNIDISNATGGVEVAEEAILPELNCTLGGTGVGVVEPLKGNLISLNSGTLSVSSE